MPALRSLKQFQVFEAAARNLSFSRAASELNVQQPAVSRQIIGLEQELGVQLFRRTKPKLVLTREGEALYAAVSNGLEVIRSAAENIRQQNETQTVVVNAAIGFTSLYLLPRLGMFQIQNPDIKLQIVTRDQNPDFDPEQADCVVVFGDRGAEELPCVPVLPEDLVPVCAPDFLPGQDPVNLSAIVAHPLLHMTSQDHAGDWELYFSGTDITVSQPGLESRFHSYMVYLQAIQNGNGIGLGWGKLIDPHLKNGTLVVACDRRVRTDRAYHCCLTARALNNAAARLFLDWIGSLEDSLL